MGAFGPHSVASGLLGRCGFRGECLRLGLADEVYYSILPILIGDGISFFEKLDRDVALHLADVKAYKSGKWSFVTRCETSRRVTGTPANTLSGHMLENTAKDSILVFSDASASH